MLSLVHTEYRFLDVMKLVMAVVVIAVHTRPEVSFSNHSVKMIFEGIYSLAVPFFFMASGFLLFRKVRLPLEDVGKDRILSYLKRILKLYVVWTMIYLPLTIYGFWKEEIPALEAIVFFGRNILLVGENYMSWPLWYLLGLITAICIIYCLLRFRFSVNGIVIISVIIAVLGVSLDYLNDNSILPYISDLYFSVFVTTRNGLFVGFMYVALGLLCTRLKTIQLWLIIMLLMLGAIGMFLKVPLSNALVVFSLFVLSISFQGNRVPLQLSVQFRVGSTIVYFVHMLFMAVLVLLMDCTKGMQLFVLVTSFSIVFSCFLMTKKETRIFDVIFR